MWATKQKPRGSHGPSHWPIHLRHHRKGPKPNTTHKNLQTINRNSRNPSLIWLAPQVATSCLRTGSWGPQRRSRDFHFKWNNRQLLRSLNQEVISLSFLFFFFSIWHCPEVESQLHGCRQWGLLSLRLCAGMGAIRNSPHLSSHDSMRALCVSLFFSCLFMSYTRGKDPATLMAGGLLLLI